MGSERKKLISEAKTKLKAMKQEFHEEFVRLGLGLSAIDRFIRIEQRLWLVSCSKNEVSLSKSYLYFSSRYKELQEIPETDDWKLIRQNLIIETNDYLEDYIWLREVRWYFEQIPYEYRLFKRQGEQLIRQVALNYNQREEWYHLLLTNPYVPAAYPLRFPEEKVSFYVPTKELGYQHVVPNERKLVTVSLKAVEEDYENYREQLLQSDQLLFPLKREKNYQPLETDLSKIKAVLPSEFLNRMSFDLEQANPDFDTIEPFKRTAHVVGPVGAGKSSYKAALIAYQVKTHQMKCGIIELTVEEANHTKKMLDSLGVRSVVLCGKSGQDRHLADLIESYYTQVDGSLNIEQLLKEELFEQLTGSCLFLDHLNLPTTKETLPCQRLREIFHREGGESIAGQSSRCSSKGSVTDDWKYFRSKEQAIETIEKTLDEEMIGSDRVSCPFYERCGAMKRFRDMFQADVWITTPQFLTQGSIPTVFERYQRTPYDLFRDYLDFIMVDEVDECQNRFDESFFNELNINTGTMNFNRQLTDLGEKIKTQLLHKGKQSNALVLKRTIQMFELAVDNCCFFARQFKSIENFAEKNCLSTTFFRHYFDVLLEDGVEKEEFLKDVSDYLYFLSEEHRQLDIVNPFPCLSFLKLNPTFQENQSDYFGKMIGRIEQFVNSKQFVIIDDYSKEEFVELFLLFALIAHLEITLKEVRKAYLLAKDELQSIKIEVDGLDVYQNRLGWLVDDPCVKDLDGFWLNLDLKKGIQIKFLQYLGVGRQLLERFSWKHFPYQQPPAVVFLSATSDAPGSAHYHVAKKVDYVLISHKKDGDIYSDYTPVSHENGLLERVSGKNGEKRKQSLRNEVYEIRTQLRRKISYEKKKILLVVNSYADCELVGEVLEQERFNYRLVLKENPQGRSTVLTKHQLKRFEVESEGADICVAPLNIIARGHNILNRKGDSYFSVAFFLVRPYLTPGDIHTCVKILHSRQYRMIQKIKCSLLSVEEKYAAWEEMNAEAFKSALQIGTWKGLSKDHRKILAWHMLIPIYQAIGRMRRNGNDCEVYWIDSAFCDAYKEGSFQTEGNSILLTWYNLLHQEMHKRSIQVLYGKLYKSVGEAIQRIDEQVEEMESYES